jgi:hypothetical protein
MRAYVSLCVFLFVLFVAIQIILLFGEKDDK